MYESPIKIITGQIKTNYEDAIYSAVQNVGINVDREELLKALKYDRALQEQDHRCDNCRNGDFSGVTIYCLLHSSVHRLDEYCSEWEEE